MYIVLILTQGYVMLFAREKALRNSQKHMPYRVKMGLQ